MIRSGDRPTIIYNVLVLTASLCVNGAHSSASDLSPIQMLVNPRPGSPSVFRSEVEVKKKLQEQFEKEVVQPIFDEIYLGKIYSRGRDDILGRRAYSAEIFSEPPINPPVGLPRNGCKDETVKNILDDPKLSECGKMSYVGFISQESEPKTFFSLPNNQGSCESSLLAGVFLVAIEEVKIELIQELQVNRISWDPNGGHAPAAKDLISVLNRIRSLPNLDKLAPANCHLRENSEQGQCSAYRYINSMEQQSINMLMNFLRMKLVDRASALYRSFTLNAMDEIRQNALTPCEPKCEDQSNANTCLQECYKNSFLSWIKNKSKSKFPLVTQACQEGGRVQ